MIVQKLLVPLSMASAVHLEAGERKSCSTSVLLMGAQTAAPARALCSQRWSESKGQHGIQPRCYFLVCSIGVCCHCREL